MLKRKIIIFSAGNEQAFSLAGPLRLAGYIVECFDNLDDVVHSCCLEKNLECKADLLIVDARAEAPNFCERFPYWQRVENLLLLREQKECPEMYCIQDRVTCVCSPSTLLAAVKDLFDSSRQIKRSRQKGCCHTCKSKEFGVLLSARHKAPV